MPASSDPHTDTHNSHNGQEEITWSPSGVVTTMWVAMSILLGMLGLFVFGLFYAVAGSAPPENGVAFNAPVIFVLGTALLVLHQLIHGAVARLLGGEPAFDVDVVHWLVPVFYCRVTDQRFTRRTYLAYLLAPLWLLSVIGLVAMLADYRGAMLIIPLGLNAALSTRDVWMAWVVWRQPAGTLVEARHDGFLIVRATAVP